MTNSTSNTIQLWVLIGHKGCRGEDMGKAVLTVDKDNQCIVGTPDELRFLVGKKVDLPKDGEVHSGQWPEVTINRPLVLQITGFIKDL
jgi:hypothetical protein